MGCVGRGTRHNAHTMPWRLYRYMLLDMLRQFALTAAVLVVVIAFGAAIKPLSNDSLISPIDAAIFVGYAMIPMLQFALPFAAAFAVTLTFHRLSQDNEIIAMAVAGQSYTRILAPFAALGISLTILLGVLTQWVIPSFIGKMAESLVADMPRMLTRSIEQHSPFVQGDLVIWAEKVYPGGKDGDRIVLHQAAVAKVNQQNRPTMYLTSTAASIDIEKNNNESSLHIRSKNTVQWTDDGGGAGSTRGALESELTHAIGINSETNRRPSTMTRRELLDAEEDPVLYPPIREAAEHLRNQLALQEYWKSLSKHFNTKKEMKFTSIINDQQLVVTSKSFKKGIFRGSINVDLLRRNGEKSLLIPKTARLESIQDPSGSVSSLTLLMDDVRVAVGEIGENIRSELQVQSLQIDADIATPAIGTNIPELLSRASDVEKGSLPKLANRLRVQIENLHEQVISRINQRWAMSASALLIVLLGSITAIRLRDKTALATFSRVFFPTVVAVILIFAGGQIVRDGRMGFGFSVMWSGNIGMMILILLSWKKLRLH
jgi:lipopolysaccharide export system permease protein